MNHPVLYFSSLCPDTPPFVAYLEQLNIEYEAINITESIENLKRFLNLRDHQEVFNEKRQLNQVGIPVLVTEEAHLLFDITAVAEYYKH